MNALIPTLIAVLLAEIGGPLATLALRRANLVAFAVSVLIVGAASAGWSLESVMTPHARTLLLGIALGISGLGQIWRGRPAKADLFGTGLTVWRSPTPFLAFGFAAWLSEPFAPAIGAAVAVAGAAGFACSGVILPPRIRHAAGGTLFLAGVFAALSGLRLIG